MGTRRPDNVHMAVWRGGCETVGQMIDQHWSVIGRCTRCHQKLEVDLDQVAKLSGRQTSLWNARGRCKIVGCGGAVKFMAKPPRVSFFQDLDAPWPEGVPATGKSGYEGPR